MSFQSFDSASHDQGAARLARLREELGRRGLDGFLVPRADRFQSEYPPLADERLRWLTGFTGSAGFCVVLKDRAAVFVDGRYTAQAKAQLDAAAYEIGLIETQKPQDWAAETAGAGARVGYDPWLMTSAEIERWTKALSAKGVVFAAEPHNPLDALWADKPAAPRGALSVHPEALAGRSSSEKRHDLADKLRKERLDGYLLTAADSVNWLLNVRGADAAHNPVALGFALLRADGSVTWFMEPSRADAALRTHLGNDVALAPENGLGAALRGLKRVGLGKADSPAELVELIRSAGGEAVFSDDPCVLPKARKTPAELAGMRAAHLRDGAAMTRFFMWFDRAAATGRLTEIEAAQKLEAIRAETGALLDLSFDTISAAGPNAALPHYRVNRDSDRVIERGSIYLIDSGAQYRDGTTDITRMIAVGNPTAEHRRLFTLALKGMIALSMARFPKGTTGAQLDTLARKALWEAGYDYDHGTGHGVGAYLSVHEGPARISKTGNVALEPGMILSNEPGYYREGAFGLRIENLLIVREGEIPPGGERPMLSFETLTLAPIDLRLVDATILTPKERRWLDAYHARVRAEVGPLLEASARAWLERATSPVLRLS